MRFFSGAELAALLAATGAGATPMQPSAVLPAEETCPGSIEFGGYGMVEIVASQWNIANEPAGKVVVDENKVIPHYKARSYFAKKCRPGVYNNTDYAAVPLLGKAISFTTDLSAAGCGCNVALYLTSLHQHSQISDCQDYYCDANSVCGVPCHEIDIMEANRHAFRTSLHTEDDRWGMTKGYGGEATDWTKEEYGPGGRCIDTTKPFQVTAGFPMDTSGNLEAMVLTLSQDGQSCKLSVTLEGYDGNATNVVEGSGQGMASLAVALAEGMTPIASSWGADDMGWMDGEGSSKLGPCKSDSESNCPDAVAMYNFYVQDLPPPADMWKSLCWVLGGLAVLALGAAGVQLFMRKSGGGSTEEESLAEESWSSVE